MPNPSQEREQGTSQAPVARRSRRRPTAVAGIVAGVALVAVIIGGALAGGLAGGATAGPSATSQVAVGPPASMVLPGATTPPAPVASADPSASPALGPSATPPSPTATTIPLPSGSPSPAMSPTPDPQALAARLDARLQAMLEKSGIPGVSAAIVWDDGRRWSGAAGSADLAARRAMTPDTAFALASVSKTFTATVVLQLVGEGRLALDQAVAPLLPAFKLDPRITVRMLLDHTSGLPDYFLNPKIDKPLQAKPAAAWTALRAWRFVPSKRAVPGTTWTYSNSNYLLLGELVTAVTGHPLATEVRRRLLDPLGLTTAWYQVAEKPRANGATGYRRVARQGGGFRSVPVAPPSSVMPFRSVVTAAGGAGSIAATAMDAALWMRAFAGGDVLPPDLQAAMLGDMTATSAVGAKIGYGLGIQAVALDGRTALGHSGRFLGFRSVVRYVPEVGVTIAVLTNQGAYDPAKIATSLLRIVAPRPTVAPSLASPSSSPQLPASPSSSPAQ